MTDSISKFYLSENSVRVTPIYILEQKANMESLRLGLESDLAFTEELHKKGLIGAYVKMRYGSRDVENKDGKPEKRYFFGMFPVFFWPLFWSR